MQWCPVAASARCVTPSTRCDKTSSLGFFFEEPMRATPGLRTRRMWFSSFEAAQCSRWREDRVLTYEDAEW